MSTRTKRRAAPSPPALPEADALAAYCAECFVNPGEPCTNYKGQAKAPCRNRGQVTAPKAATLERGLFDPPAEEAPQDTAAVDVVLWGKHPAHGAAWLKLAVNTSAADRQARHAEGWELTTRPTGEHPDEPAAVGAAPMSIWTEEPGSMTEQFAAMFKAGPVHFEELARLTGWERTALAGRLMTLELWKRVRRLPGERYELRPR